MWKAMQQVFENMFRRLAMLAEDVPAVRALVGGTEELHIEIATILAKSHLQKLQAPFS